MFFRACLPVRHVLDRRMRGGVGSLTTNASLCSGVLLLAMSGVAQSQQVTSDAERVFDRYAKRTVHIQISDVGSDAPSATASGFFVSAQGHLVTNHHVVADLVREPEKYRAEMLVDDETTALRVLAVDVVHDIAIVQCDSIGMDHFELRQHDPDQGTRLFAFGHPRRLELSIVEGIHNGLLEHRLYERIHFTGSLNPGMSGGPAITSDGRVVGVNVSTQGEQLSFLVPVERAIALLSMVEADDYSAPDDFFTVITEQVTQHQSIYVDSLLGSDFPTVRLGPYEVPTEPAQFFECWGETVRDEVSPYEFVDHQCSVPDDVYLSGDHSVGEVSFFHRMISSEELNRFQFYNLYSSEFQNPAFWFGGNEEHVTTYHCDTDNVRHSGGTFRVVFCTRRHKKLPGLYDVVLKAAGLGHKDVGIETTLMLTGVSFENGRSVAHRYLEAIKWVE